MGYIVKGRLGRGQFVSEKNIYVYVWVKRFTDAHTGAPHPAAEGHGVPMVRGRREERRGRGRGGGGVVRGRGGGRDVRSPSTSVSI